MVQICNLKFSSSHIKKKREIVNIMSDLTQYIQNTIITTCNGYLKIITETL